MRRLLPQVLVLGILGQFTASCGETVNYDTEEKFNSAAVVGGDNQSDNATGTGPDDENAGSGGESSGGGGSGDGQLPLLCQNGAAVQSEDAVLSFPEIPAGTTCAFGSGDNLSRRDLFFRAYLRQSQTVELPEGAVLCGFSLKHDDQAMRYDDEMFFTVNDKLLLSTKNYSEFFATDGFFHEFSWDNLRDKPYDPADTARGVYCAGGSNGDGLNSCKVPETETAGSIELDFSEDLNRRLASALQAQNVLRFDWITTGDNDNTDCRHSSINLQLSVQYVLP